ncbi:isochorismate synthase MenF [Aquamicrobium segne]|uniref:isochorismate synthase n=1 Tax=Aquamicrobium segne TaxID=469547 RepID=A0ABW0H1K0_9HYPH
MTPDKSVEFWLSAQTGSFSASGQKQLLPRGPVSTLAARAQAFMNTLEDGPSVLVGAVPFDRNAADFIYQPVSTDNQPRLSSDGVTQATLSGACTITPAPSAQAYGAAVARCLQLIAGTRGEPAELRKVVLSRTLELAAAHDIDPEWLFGHLGHDRSITAFMTPLPSNATGAPPMLIGATPELLVSRIGRTVVSHPLAGSSRRHADSALDRQSAQWLERSDKNRREHMEVVDAVTEALAPFCDDVSTPEGTTLRPTATMWHLGTRIVGTLKDPETPVGELVNALHPTPAVCGMPRERAAQVIHDLEGYDRGFYAGTVGWMNASGDGEWYVALRCAEVHGAKARLFAGAGIVEGSEPAAEIDETSGKLLAILGALGIDENGHLLREQAA